MAAAAGSTAPPPISVRYSDESLKDGINRMRDTAKWLILCFGAVVNAFILAGIGLSNLSDVKGSRLPVVILAILVAIVAVAVAIVAASKVLTAGQLTLAELTGSADDTRGLRAELALARELYPGYASIEDLADDLTTTGNTQVEAARALHDGTGDEATRIEYERANSKVRVLTPLIDRLLLVAGFKDVRRKLDHNRKVIAGCFIAVVAAATVFAICIETPQAKQAVRAATLSFVRADLTANGEHRLRPVLGRQCDFDNVSALVLGGGGSAIKLLTLPRFGCAVTTVTMSRSDATVEPVGLPSIELP